MNERHVVGLLDTSVVIDLGVIGEDHLPKRAQVSAVTLAELALGLHTVTDADERAARQELIQHAEAKFSPVPFTELEARRFGQCVGLLVAIGRSPRPRRQDLMIAATASVHQLPLYTRNPDDFRGLETMVTVVPV